MSLEYRPKDFTLVTVNWNQRACIELLLKSYVQHHYIGYPLRLILWDNHSSDDSRAWLKENEIPFASEINNIGHEKALNRIYRHHIRTKYALIVDSDIQFKDFVWDYVDCFNETCIAAGEMIDKNFINETKIKDRISPWFMLFDFQKAKASGIENFRTNEDWTYDVGSEFTEELFKRGFTHYNIDRLPGDQDNDLISMKYEKVRHWGKVSWDLNEHHDRITEILRRRQAIEEELKVYSHIDLKGKFIYG